MLALFGDKNGQKYGLWCVDYFIYFKEVQVSLENNYHVNPVETFRKIHKKPDFWLNFDSN